MTSLSGFDKKKIDTIINTFKKSGREAFLEPEGLELLGAMGFKTPEYSFVKGSSDLANNKLPIGQRIVVKVVSPEILHKSDVGGVHIIGNNMDAISSTISGMEERFKDQKIEGFIICECVNFESELGNEILIGLRNTNDYGPILTFGFGGIYTEFLSANFEIDKNISIISPENSEKKVIEKSISSTALSDIITKSFRGKKARVSVSDLSEIIIKFIEFSKIYLPAEISEFEVNPFVIINNEIVALDVLIKKSTEETQLKKERPTHKIKQLLEPKSAAIVGVSEKMNIGHIILNNFIKEGFSKKDIFIVKDGTENIEGCKCYPDIKDLPSKVDIFILCTPAATIPEIITELISHQKAESIVVIPGGLEEKEGSGEIVKKMNYEIEKSRESEWKGPVINGGNCLGIISRPGKYDTMFIPDYKKTEIVGSVSPLAFISQSGAFAVSRLNKLVGLNPKFSITIGNQMDLTLGDYLNYLKDDPDIQVYAIYLEGFKPQDGKKFIKAAREIIKKGKQIVFYCSGKTAEGAKAMASHTASIAGDYMVTKKLCKDLGVVLADNFADFEDLTRLFVCLQDKKVSGKKLGVVSNAGCECVAASDNLETFNLAMFTNKTNDKLEKIFKEARIDAIVDLHNPVDLTPMAGDKPYEETIKFVMEDENVDVGLIACIPLAPTINALPKSDKHREDYLKETSIVQRMIKLNKSLNKAWVAVIDAGPLFDPMERLFVENEIPTFRTIDRAIKLFNIYCESKLR